MPFYCCKCDKQGAAARVDFSASVGVPAVAPSQRKPHLAKKKWLTDRITQLDTKYEMALIIPNFDGHICR